MEKFADKIEQLLQKKLSLYEKIQNILLDEKAYIVDMNVDALWDTTSKKKSLSLSIEAIRHEITCLFNEFYSGLEMDTQAMKLSEVIKMLNVSSEKKSNLKKIVMAIDTLKDDIGMLASNNKNFISEYLSVIDGVFSTVLKRDNKKKYNNSGIVAQDSSNSLLINAEV